MKRFLGSLLTFVLCIAIIYYRKPIGTYLYKNFVFKKEAAIPRETLYKRDYDFAYVQNTYDFSPKNKKELVNIIYTILNSRWTKFSFYCADEYKDCAKEVNEIGEDENILTFINNFVHPYNTYFNISISINNFDEITINVDYLYDMEDIREVEKQVDFIFNKEINDTMSDYEKIKKIHDYIVNTTSYDEEKVKDEVNSKKYKYKTNMAYGPLIHHIAICGGYTDAMAIFLDKMKIKNYRIASENHIWNLVYLNGEWKHLDLTWDDPSYEKEILTHNFFLITTSKLKNLDAKQHNYNTSIYIEAK